MNDTTNVLNMPARRRSDAPAEPERRSSPAFASVPVLPPSPLDEPFADAMIAADRANRAKRLAAAAARRMEDALAAQQLRRKELLQARDEGFARGDAHGYREGWYWGLALGLIVGGSMVAIALKAGWWAVAHS